MKTPHENQQIQGKEKQEMDTRFLDNLKGIQEVAQQAAEEWRQKVLKKRNEQT